MLSLLLRSGGLSRARAILLGVGLSILSAGILLLTAASRTTTVVASEDISRYWRTTYDILVRPAAARSPIEEQYGLVEANSLSGISGGITFAQYEDIRAIPGVEVAAPIAMIGYVAQIVPAGTLASISDPGAYVQSQTLTIDDGANLYPLTKSDYYYIGNDPNPSNPCRGPGCPMVLIPGYHFSPTFPVVSKFDMPFLVAGVDPSQEAALVGLEQALRTGRYLRPDEPLNRQQDPDRCPNYTTFYELPILINGTPYIRLKVEAELRGLALPPDTAGLEAIMEQGGTSFLASLPGTRLAHQVIDNAEAYERLVDSLLFFGGGAEPAGFVAVSTGHTFMWSVPSPIIYRETQPPFAYNGLVLEIVPPAQGMVRTGTEGGLWPAYRRSEESKIPCCFSFGAKGVFDIERLAGSADVNRVPQETYFPPVVTLRYDEQGRPVEPRPMYPTLDIAGYIQPPPLVLTTLEAARVLCGDASISAIRVRVGGIERLTPAAQRKIEAIATEIQRRTGLAVDVMVGSSPTRILVHVPGIGYVEEQWVQKGVALSYQEHIQSGYWILLVVLLSVGGLYVTDLTWAEVMARQRTIALQKALGWRSSTVFGRVVGQVMMIGALAAAMGVMGAWAVARLAGWKTPGAALLLGTPVVTVVLCIVSSLYPAWLAGRVPPNLVLRGAGLRYTRVARGHLAGMWGYAWRGLMRRRGRTALNGLAAMLSSALLVLLLEVTLEQRGYLAGTLLGEYIAGHVSGYHYGLVGLGFALMTLGVANTLLEGALERGREIGVLKAMGWHTPTVARLFVMEGLLLGMAGGVAGALLGGATFFWLYRSLPPTLWVIGLVGMATPGLVGALAALYPAGVAARVSPATVMRNE